MLKIYLTVLKKSFVFSGRATRSEYWYFVLMNLIISTLLLSIDIYLLIPERMYLYGVYTLFALIPFTSVSVRRFHDLGKSGWWLFAGLSIPFLGIIFLFYFFVKDSMEDNQYGQNPKNL
jgi:uncharacterized membrane protein YhaH (DUF805 family)